MTAKMDSSSKNAPICRVKNIKLTVTTSRSSLEHKPVGHRSISAQVRKVPVANDNRRDVPGQSQQAVAQVKSCGSAL